MVIKDDLMTQVSLALKLLCSFLQYTVVIFFFFFFCMTHFGFDNISRSVCKCPIVINIEQLLQLPYLEADINFVREVHQSKTIGENQ